MMLNFAKHLVTFEEYVYYQQDNEICYELIDGELAAMPPALFKHLVIADFIDTAFKQQIIKQQLPWVSLREIGIRTAPYRSRIADICVMTQQQLAESIDKIAILQTPPLLAVEVVSPESVKRDYRYKRSEYASLGIPEYWIVDALEAKVSVLRLEDGFYEMTVFNQHQQIYSHIFPELNLFVTDTLMMDVTRTL